MIPTTLWNSVRTFRSEWMKSRVKFTRYPRAMQISLLTNKFRNYFLIICNSPRSKVTRPMMKSWHAWSRNIRVCNLYEITVPVTNSRQLTVALYRTWRTILVEFIPPSEPLESRQEGSVPPRRISWRNLFGLKRARRSGKDT